MYWIIPQSWSLQWCDTLEELLQCPVCLEATQGMKIQCVNGHHVCKACKDQLNGVCPICKSSFMGIRNLAVEQISAKLEDIKVWFLFPVNAANNKDKQECCKDNTR